MLILVFFSGCAICKNKSCFKARRTKSKMAVLKPKTLTFSFPQPKFSQTFACMSRKGIWAWRLSCPPLLPATGKAPTVTFIASASSTVHFQKKPPQLLPGFCPIIGTKKCASNCGILGPLICDSRGWDPLSLPTGKVRRTGSESQPQPTTWKLP